MICILNKEWSIFRAVSYGLLHLNLSNFNQQFPFPRRDDDLNKNNDLILSRVSWYDARASLEMDSFYCIFCTEKVTSRQEALLCDGCDRWQHRCCKTGITREQYRAAVRSGKEVIWRCLNSCENFTDHSLPVAENTRLEETDNFNVPASFEDSSSLNQETGMTILVIEVIKIH